MVFLLVAGLAFGQDQYEKVKDQYKKVKTIGLAPLQSGGVHDEQEVMDLLNREQEAIAAVFNHNDALIKIFLQHMSGDMEIGSQWFVKGDRFLSNIYRYVGKIFNVGKWEWTGEKPFDAFVFPIEQDLGDIIRQYWIVVIKDCANIVLWKIEDIAIEKIEEPIVPTIKEWPSRISLKAESKPEPPPEIKPMPKQERAVKRPTRVNYFVGTGVGTFYSCFMEYWLFEVGAKRNLFGLMDVVMSMSAGMPIGKEKSDWNTVPIVGIGLQLKLFDPFYLGADVGLSGKMKEGLKTQAEFGAEMGFHVGNTLGVYLRARVPLDEKAGWNYKIIGGVRIFF